MPEVQKSDHSVTEQHPAATAAEQGKERRADLRRDVAKFNYFLRLATGMRTDGAFGLRKTWQS